ncbi:hypothetical protein BJ138DRAFT_1110916 [Hygrophoropsis aurantiaca]|uniref:Uncharacterized protein n=1 Tax=Hygrophoropsis aurantiaca TaxID=72124 RepID=A0ACB8AL61_9AGAM|nr:hypothetical protein BJ138DRAFT_1110916 [Hygrophoropsis aurantiaca]
MAELRALLTSLSPSDTSSPSSGKLSPAQLQKLSSKIDELLGGSIDGSDSAKRNEKGELLNEEGLPIIDITEPLSQSVDAESPQPPLLIDTPDLVPLNQLPSLEQERRRRERDRILDLLEEEERAQLAKDEEEEEEQRRETLRKRKEAAKQEMERLRAAKEMQKKMGKALLRNIAEARDKEEKALKELNREDEVKAASSSLKPKKSVTFAAVEELPSDDDEQGAAGAGTKGNTLDWGDVAPARLRSSNRVSLPTKAQLERHPMKMQVVERYPASAPYLKDLASDKDSDDESDIASAASSASSPPSEPEDEDEEDDEIGDQEVLEDDLDWDSAKHQREVALEYYRKRLAVGADAAQAMISHTHDEDEWDQPEVPLDATLAGPRPKPPVSRFKADRIATSYNVSRSSASTSLGPSVIPASKQKSLQSAVRIGKLENDQLIGGEAGESGSEEEAMREVLEMLKSGQIQNAGPNFVPPASSECPAPSDSGSAFRPQMDDKQSAPPSVPPPLRAPKPSKFKLARKQHTVDVPPASDTPISAVDRSSPKIPISGIVERNVPNVSRQQAIPSIPTQGGVRQAGQPQGMPSMVVDSPSFPANDYSNQSRSGRPPVVMSMMVKEKAPINTRK